MEMEINGQTWETFMRQNYQVLVIDEMPGVKEEEVSKMPGRYLCLPNVLANIHLHI